MAAEGSASTEIGASAEAILGVINDVEAYPLWMERMKRAVVLERDAEGRPRRAEFEVDAKWQTLRYTLEYEYQSGGVSWHSVAGDLKEISGSYRVESRDAATTVTYDYSIDPGFPIPEFLMRKAVKVLVGTALDDLRRRVEPGRP